jgi:p-aminobenzoyl-glutamate transporter AbgT
MIDCRRCVKFAGISFVAMMSASRIASIIAVRAARQIDGCALPAVSKRYSPVGGEW